MVIYVNDSGVFRSDNSMSYNSASQVNRIEKLTNVNSDTSSVVREAQKAYVAENTPAYNISISSAGKAAVQSLKALGEGLSKLNGKTDFASMITSNLRDGLNDGRNRADRGVQNDQWNAADRNGLNAQRTETDNNGLNGLNRNRFDEPRTGAYTNRYLDNTDDSVTGIYDVQQSNVRLTSSFADNTETEEVSVTSETPQARPAEPSQIADEDYDAGSAASASVNTGNLTRYTEFQLRQMVVEGTITSADMNGELDKRASDTGLRIEPSQEAAMKQAVAAYDYQMAYQINASITQ
ncbi:MAG: hypothetical protein K6E62_12000 [Lachnospiraceae bacterium]|nr:hypothetical protein [Lachnospiraceae bacterium]